MISDQQVREEFNRFFIHRTLSSTYKPYFLKSLLELPDFFSVKPFHGKQWIQKNSTGLKIDLEFIASRFAYLYWNPYFKFRLKQSPNPKKDVYIYNILNGLQKILGERKQIPKITVFCSPKYTKFRKRIIVKCIKPDVLKRLLKDCKIYDVTIDRNFILVPNVVINFIKRHRPVLKNALDFVITSYLETCNSSPQIATKISEKPPVSKLKKIIFEKIVTKQKKLCFYCEKRKITVQEHVIPKDYVWETKAYNIVGACEKCNREKWHNRLPIESIFNQVLERNDSEWFSDLLKNESYSRDGYQLQYENCYQDYSKEELWKPE